MGVRRFTRLTNVISKKLENHAHHVALMLTYYNFCRIQKALQVTPAMAAGVTSELLRDVDWIAPVVDARDPEAGRGGRTGSVHASAADPAGIPNAAAKNDPWGLWWDLIHWRGYAVDEQSSARSGRRQSNDSRRRKGGPVEVRDVRYQSVHTG